MAKPYTYKLDDGREFTSFSARAYYNKKHAVDIKAGIVVEASKSMISARLSKYTDSKVIFRPTLWSHYKEKGYNKRARHMESHTVKAAASHPLLTMKAVMI